MPETFHFEDLLPSAGTEYDILYEFEPGTSANVSRVVQWASGNPGYELTRMANSRIDYPTQQTTDGYNHTKGIKLTTCDTGEFGERVNMHIAAGNLFIGSFDLANALNAPLRATKFGIQYYKRPIALKGYFKFKAGDVYTDGGVEQKDMNLPDSFAVKKEVTYDTHFHNSTMSAMRKEEIAQFIQSLSA